jgi:hypothetical protein
MQREGAVMGYALAFSACIGCGRMFAYNPMKVPSVRINGEREPLCQVCTRRLNMVRAANGLEPIVPAPDAWEPVAEEELP